MRTDDGDRLATHDQLKYLYAESQDQVDTRLLENFDWDSDLNLEDINDYNCVTIKYEIVSIVFNKVPSISNIYINLLTH